MSFACFFFVVDLIVQFCELLGEIESSKERSRLSKTLKEILTDKAALTYFTQYLESRHASSYIRCWLDIQNFKEIVQEKVCITVIISVFLYIYFFLFGSRTKKWRPPEKKIVQARWTMTVYQ